MSVLSCYFLQGITRLLLTKIPFFREVIISSFQCDACGYSDCGIQSGSRVQDKGVRYTLTVKGTKVWYLNDICELQLVISFVKCQFWLYWVVLHTFLVFAVFYKCKTFNFRTLTVRLWSPTTPLCSYQYLNLSNHQVDVEVLNCLCCLTYILLLHVFCVQLAVITHCDAGIDSVTYFFC